MVKVCLRQCGTIFDNVDIDTQETDAPVSINAVTCLLTDLKKMSTVESLKKFTSIVLLCEMAFSEGMTVVDSRSPGCLGE